MAEHTLLSTRLHFVAHMLTVLKHCGPTASLRHFQQCWACSVGSYNTKLHFIALLKGLSILLDYHVFKTSVSKGFKQGTDTNSNLFKYF